MPSRNPMPARTIGASTSFLPDRIGDFIVRERRLDLDHFQRQVARHLVAEQFADLAETIRGMPWSSVPVAQQRQLVLHQRVIDDGDAAHGVLKFGLLKTPCRR